MKAEMGQGDKGASWAPTFGVVHRWSVAYNPAGPEDLEKDDPSVQSCFPQN